MIELWPDGWHVAAYVDGTVVQRSPAFEYRSEAWRQAKVVDKQLKDRFPGRNKIEAPREMRLV